MKNPFKTYTGDWAFWAISFLVVILFTPNHAGWRWVVTFIAATAYGWFGYCWIHNVHKR